MGMRRWGLGDVLLLLIGMAIVTCVVAGGLVLRRNYAASPEISARRRALQAVDRVIYAHDAKNDVCFVVTWVTEGERFTYMLAWIPCLDRLPMATVESAPAAVSL